MRSHYKKLGSYIREVSIRNTDLMDKKLLGVSIQKVLMPSIANLVGTDMATYRIIKRDQFAYGPVTSRNGDKISVALLTQYDEAIVSQAYIVFEIIDQNELHPEYLMMWFRRSEFDRYARFKSHGSAREIFDWNEMCQIELPIPNIERQREIVKEYNVITKRAKLNEQLIRKLEETARALYKQWFIDFEFPNENGKPYRSCGGKMVWNEQLKQDIPMDWRDGYLEDLMLFKNGKTKPNSYGQYPAYGGNGVISYVGAYNYEDIIAIGRVGAYCGSVYRVLEKCWVSDNAISGISKSGNNMYCFDLLKTLNLNEKSEGTGQPLLTQGILNTIKILLPDNQVVVKYNAISSRFFNTLSILRTELKFLVELNLTLLSKMSKPELLEIEQPA